MYWNTTKFWRQLVEGFPEVTGRFEVRCQCSEEVRMCCSEGKGSVVSQSLELGPGFVCGEALGRLKRGGSCGYV